MFGSLGFPEILFILVLALLVFGPKRLPEIGRTVGRALGEFRRATGDLKRSLDHELTLDPDAAPRPATATQARGESSEADGGEDAASGAEGAAALGDQPAADPSEPAGGEPEASPEA